MAEDISNAPATGVAGWFADPNNQKLLAGIGGALGAPYAKTQPGLLAGSQLATGMINAKAAQNAAGTESQKQSGWQTSVANAIKQLAGIHTPPGVEGVTGTKMGKDGTLSIDYNPPPGEGWQPKPQGGFASSSGDNPAYPADNYIKPSASSVPAQAPTGTDQQVNDLSIAQSSPNPTTAAGQSTGVNTSQRLSRAQQLSSLVPFF